MLASPGNHDRRDGFRAWFGDNPEPAPDGPLHFAAGDLGPLRILGLDVMVPGHHHGDLDDAACRWLEERLAEEPGRPTLIMMHQPPFESGIPFIDIYHCRRGGRLARIVTRGGRAHPLRAYPPLHAAPLRGTMLVTGSGTTTAIALRPRTDAAPASFLEPPAVLLHRWTPSTGLVTHLLPIGTFPGPFEFR